MPDVNTNQAIFDAIAAAVTSFGPGKFNVNVNEFIDTFNAHRDRKLCTSLDLVPMKESLNDAASIEDQQHPPPRRQRRHLADLWLADRLPVVVLYDDRRLRRLVRRRLDPSLDHRRMEEQVTASLTPEQHDAIYLRGWSEGVEAAINAMPSTAEDPNEDTYQRGRFDGIMEYQRAMRDLSERSPASAPAQAAPEPVAWRIATPDGYVRDIFHSLIEATQEAEEYERGHVEPLYARPQPSSEAR